MNLRLGTYQSLEAMNATCIDYEHTIQEWIIGCLQECTNKPFLRESLLQYLEIINRMANNTASIEERLEIRDIIATSQETMEGCRLLVSNFHHVKWHTTYDFWQELAQALQQAGYTIISQPSKEDITNTTHYESYKKDYTSKNDYGIYFKVVDGLVLYIWNGTNEDWLYWGGRKQDIQESYSQKSAIT